MLKLSCYGSIRQLHSNTEYSAPKHYNPNAPTLLLNLINGKVTEVHSLHFGAVCLMECNPSCNMELLRIGGILAIFTKKNNDVACIISPFVSNKKAQMRTKRRRSAD